MKALQFDRKGALDALRFTDLPRPKPAEGEVLVAVQAAGINPSDVKNVLGLFPYTTLPRVPGRDFAGTVVEGPAHLLGQDVWGTGKGLGFTRDGSHAEFLTLPADGVTVKPKSLSFTQAAACGVPYSTAWDALERGGVVRGTRLLVVGANGAVGRAALALARWRGAQVLAAVRQPTQAAALEASGTASITLSSDAPEALAPSVLSHFGGSGAEVIFDTTGFWLAAAVPALADFGRIAVIAAPLDAGHVRVPVLNLYRRCGSIVGINTLLYTPTDCVTMLDTWTAGFDSGALALPDEPRAMSLSEGLSAYQILNAGSSEKIVLTTGAA